MSVKLADYFTWSRLLLYIPITVAAYLDAKYWVLFLFLIAQSTDFLDGYIARKTKTASKAGAALDSRVDTVGVPFYLAWLWMLFPEFFIRYWPAIMVMIASLVLALAASYWRTKGITGLHLWSGKAAAVLGTAFLPALILVGVHPWLVWIVLGTGVLSNVEELAFWMLNKNDIDAKSVFH